MYIYSLRGTVGELQKNLIVLECGGVGYECVCSSYTISQIKSGEQVKLYIYCSVREDALELFGFFTKEEKECFEKLISVSGVGPKAAISILSATTPSGFKRAVLTGEEKILTSAPGIGKKLAQRILLELKDKLSLEDELDGEPVVMPAKESAGQKDAYLALAALGYSQSEISQALKGQNTEGLRTEEIVRLVLRSMVMKA